MICYLEKCFYRSSLDGDMWVKNGYFRHKGFLSGRILYKIPEKANIA
jgi:hypothetical protein